MTTFEPSPTDDFARNGVAASADIPVGVVDEPPRGKRRERGDVDIRRAYQRGRRDERALERGSRKRGSWFASGLLLITACFTVLVVGLAVRGGSFARGGEVLDQGVANASSSAMRVTKLAEAKAGQAMQKAGGRLQHSASGHV